MDTELHSEIQEEFVTVDVEELCSLLSRADDDLQLDNFSPFPSRSAALLFLLLYCPRPMVSYSC